MRIRAGGVRRRLITMDAAYRMAGIPSQQTATVVTLPPQVCSITSLRPAFCAPTVLTTVLQLEQVCLPTNTVFVLSLESCVVVDSNFSLQHAATVAGAAAGVGNTDFAGGV